MALEGDYETAGVDPVEQMRASIDFFRTGVSLNPCCEKAVATATDNLAILANDLFRKAEAALDKAVAQVTEKQDAGGAEALTKVAETYLILAEATV
jgi:hypothetical protein